ncbi:MAG TPA: PAC2 family protein [Candidatus Bathyarchaeia archaeon]|nr:PAC2 family protein [Candidatus Bathyarchaeia archaeon]
MSITRRAWINYRDTRKLKLKDPIAIVGSPGLRSVGKLVVDALVEKSQPQLFAELFSYGFPSIYYGPSYLGAASSVGAQLAKDNVVELPSVKLYILSDNEKQAQAQSRDIVIISGYQAYDALNHYMVAEKLTDLFAELHIKKVISLGAQVMEEGIRCCATDVELLGEMSKYGIEKTHVDRFIGFSGLVAAIGREKGIKGVCLFANTAQNPVEPEYPDFNAAKGLLEKVGEIAGLKVDISDLEERRRSEGELIEAGITRESEGSGEQEREREREDLIGYA